MKSVEKQRGRTGGCAPFLAEYQNKAAILGANPNSTIPQAEQDEFQAHRRQSLRMYAYMNRIKNLCSPYMEDASYIFALFDLDGYLLKLVGTESVLADMRRDGIVKGAIWNMSTVGPNAVTIGLERDKSLYSSGQENYHTALQKYAIYFSPVILLDSCLADTTERFGGVALILPVALANPEHLLTTFSIANSIILLWSESRHLYHVYESMGYAMMTFDINIYNKKVFTFYHSQNIFDVLGVPPADIYIQPTADFIDPLPKNKEFWAILSGLRRVADLELTLSVRGKEANCIVTTEPNNQPNLGMRGIHFYITTAKRANSHIAKKMGSSAAFTFRNIIGESPRMKSAVQKAKKLANSYANIMLLGESGVGKDLFAQAIHNASDRRDKPFIAINCGALPRDLIASEFFGYDRGAFTGAKSQGNIGKFELAEGGTIFLDEIGEMPLDLQATLLRVVEQRQFMRIGSNRLIDVDIKIISATNVDIFSMIEEKRFRADLYYRLSTMHLDIPPLRERESDIVLLAEHFIQSIVNRIGRTDIPVLSPEAKRALKQLPWDGNVRELQNLIDCIVQLYPELIITAEHIMENIHLRSPKFQPMVREVPSAYPKKPTPQRLLTQQEIADALVECGGNRSQAARLLGIDRRAFYRNLERLNMN